jgi:hypothetical protein
MAPRQLTGNQNTPPRLRISAAASVAVHLAALALLLLFTDIRSYEAVNPDSIAVDLVAAEDIKSLLPDPPPPPKPADPPPAEPPPQTQPSPPPQQQAQQQPQPPQQPAAKAEPRPQPKPVAKQAAASSPPIVQPQPATPLPFPSPLPAVVPQAPDITERYQVLLGLPAIGSEDGGGEATERAKLAVSDIERLRAHVRSCSTLPGGVAPTDKVRIVMRIWLTPDRQLVRPPALVEASPSVKGPALMQAAIKALQDCAPYAMLPADKYQEWQSLDISFTPRDFPG